MLDILDMGIFSFGLSSGVRIIGSIAIAGCLLSAIGYGVSDYVNQ
jgi:VanZ family protein